MTDAFDILQVEDLLRRVRALDDALDDVMGAIRRMDVRRYGLENVLMGYNGRLCVYDIDTCEVKACILARLREIQDGVLRWDNSTSSGSYSTTRGPPPGR